jgi:serine/threonine-protein kinase
LSPRDSLLILSDSGSSADPKRCCSVDRRRFALLDEAARRYPEDPEVWYQLGEARFHTGFVVGKSWRDARDAFDRAIALDSAFAPAYIHPVEISLNDNDSDAALRYVRGYLAISSVIPSGAMRLLGKVLASGTAHPPDVAREAETASVSALHLLGLSVRLWPDGNETQLKVWPRIADGVRAHPSARDTALARVPGFVLMVPTALIHRGHLREARVLVGNRVSAPFMELAALGAIPPETVETALAEWLRHPSFEDASLGERFTAGPCSRTMDAALWWASRKDTTKLRRLAAREESATRAKAIRIPDIVTRRPVPGFVQAALALAQGDTTHALSRFLAFPDSSCLNARQLREVKFRLLAATGRDADAAAVFDGSNDRWVPLVLERARLAERLNDRATAVKYYRFVADAWLHADPELQPVVAEARAAIARLHGERGQ